MAGYDVVGPLDYLNGVAADVAGVQQARIGVAKAPAAAVSVTVTMGGFAASPRLVGGVSERIQRYYLTVGYRVLGADTLAEKTLAAVVNGLVETLEDDKQLGGTVATSTIDGSVADVADYAILAGQEYRVYPIVVTATQRRTFARP